MARVQLIIPDTDRALFVDQARREGKSFSAWLRAAAHARLEERQRVRRFESPEDVRDFFRACETVDGPEAEPDWSTHLQVIRESRASGTTAT